MKQIIFVLFILALTPNAFTQGLNVVNIRCEGRTSPLGIEKNSPSLSWELSSSGRGILQKAYRILVSDNESGLNRNIGSIWDSKKVLSDSSIHVAFKGSPLQPVKTYYWKVQVWDNKGNVCWSKPSKWQMGLMSSEDWKGAKWIGYERLEDSLRVVPAEHGRGSAKWSNLKNTLPLLRKSFGVRKPIKKASVFISGLGHFELSINGKKIGDHFLDPGWTEYDKEAQYVPFDVTKTLVKGRNAIGVMLGNGFYFMPRQRYRKLTGAYGFPKMILRLVVEYHDGSIDNIVSDHSWKTAESPITFSSIYGGEDYNAAMEQKGWNTPSFNDRHWKHALEVSGPPVLYAQASPLKIHEQFDPVKSTSVKDNVFVFDLGQNASGIFQIRVKGKRGDTVRIVPAELLKEDGTANQRHTGSPVYFDYILKGEGTETWQPRFSYYGFRYLQVERAVPQGTFNPDSLPVLVQIRGLHTRNSVRETGSFISSSDLFNRTGELIKWAIKSNMASVLTDCPHREKLGWLEQTHLMGNSIRYNYDMLNFFRKTIRDMKTAQSTDDVVPEYVPEFVKMPFMEGIFMDSPEWGSASIILPWYLYHWYGDRQTLEESYPMMKRYLAHLKRKSKDHIISYGLSDWYDIGPNRSGLAQLTPMGITATAIYYYDLNIMTKIARILNKEEEAREYEQLAPQVRVAFNKTFFNKDSMQYGSGSQTANAMAVYMKLVEPEYKDAVVENIIRDIRSRNNSITAGDVGFRYLLRVLDEEGRSDVIFDMNSRTDVPGYGYQLERGATALTESWQASPLVSNNHLMLGHLMEWFYTGLGGISQDSSSIAFKKILIRPQPVGNITSVKSHYVSSYGLIETDWKKEGSKFILKVKIPANTTADILMPIEYAETITGNGKSLTASPDMKSSTSGDGRRLISIGSGSYQFISSGIIKRTTKN